jgi:hypothetical protein
MPCYDGREAEVNSRNYQLSAVLCGIITKHGTQILDTLDWKEIGVKRSVVDNWWKEHLAADARRREFARKQRATNQLANTAVNKLTPAELAAILKTRK